MITIIICIAGVSWLMIYAISESYKDLLSRVTVGICGAFIGCFLGITIANGITLFLPTERRDETTDTYQLVSLAGEAGTSGYVYVSDDLEEMGVYYQDEFGVEQKIVDDPRVFEISIEDVKPPYAELRYTLSKCSAKPTYWTMMFSLCYLRSERAIDRRYFVFVPDRRLVNYWPE